MKMKMKDAFWRLTYLVMIVVLLMPLPCIALVGRTAFLAESARELKVLKQALQSKRGEIL